MRIPIPTQPSELTSLCDAIAKEHKKQGKESPLAILDWQRINPTVAEAADVDAKITELNLELGKLNERRRRLIDAPAGLADFARQSRDILAGVYRNEMTKLVDFGFVVSATRSRREKKPIALAA